MLIYCCEANRIEQHIAQLEMISTAHIRIFKFTTSKNVPGHHSAYIFLNLQFFFLMVLLFRISIKFYESLAK
jgi:hypothetical protein